MGQGPFGEAVMSDASSLSSSVGATYAGATMQHDRIEISIFGNPSTADGIDEIDESADSEMAMCAEAASAASIMFACKQRGSVSSSWMP